MREFVQYLGDVTIRSICFAAAGMLLVWMSPRKTASGRHAALTVIAAGMLLLPALTRVVPPITLKLLPEVANVPSMPLIAPAPGTAPLASPVSSALVPLRAGSDPIDWVTVAACSVYLAGLLLLLLRLSYAYFCTRRLVRSGQWNGNVCESEHAVVPMTFGWMRPAILMPAGWKDWEPAKRDAVLTHERMHIRCGDWTIAMLAASNRCVFWYNPFVWWMERQLASLAEQACDDAVLLETGNPEAYAETLLEMAAAARRAGGRLSRHAVAMAQRSEMRQRIERILDEAREVPPALTRRAWTALAACGGAAVFMAAALQVVPSRSLFAQTVSWKLERLAPKQVQALENEVAQNPEDLHARERLIMHYLVTGENVPRAKHVLWMIEHHPESDVHQFPALFGDPGPLQDVQSYELAAVLWQAASRSTDPRVNVNAAKFLETYFGFYAGDLKRAEEWIAHGRAVDPNNPHWSTRLAGYYAISLLDAAGERMGSARDIGYAAPHARSELERSKDGVMLYQAGALLASRPAGQNAALLELNSFGQALIRRARELGYNAPDPGEMQRRLRDAEAQLQGVSEPAPVKRVDPVYPPLAQMARVQGSVRLRVSVAQDGAVQNVQLISGHPLLIQAATDAVKQWVYAPQAAATQVEVTVPFRLPSPAHE